MGTSQNGIPTFGQAWSVQSDIAKGCREFNTLQFQYRQLALTLILAAYAAMGYFIVNETPAKDAVTVQVVMPAGGAVPPGSSGPTVTASAISPATPSLSPGAAPPESPSTRFRRVSLLLLGIGLLSSFATLSIWLIDVSVYHRLLRANFDAGKDFELALKAHRHETWPPFISIQMAKYIPGRSVVIWMCCFYALGVLAGPMPWAIHTGISSVNTNGDWWNTRNAAEVAMIALAVSVIGVALLLAKSKREARPPSRSPAPSAEAPAAAGADHAASGMVQQLFRAAAAARQNAYAEYSDFPVGAAVLAVAGGDARVFSGCNVENAASGETLCAERNAIAAAVAAGFRNIRELLVYGDDTTVTPPCGSCRSVLHEFNPYALVHLASAAGVHETLKLPELYPHPFGPESLERPSR